MQRKIGFALLAVIVTLNLALADRQLHGGTVTVNFDAGTTNNTTALTGYATTGDLMAGMDVTVFFADGTSESAAWVSLGYPSGQAVGTGWFLAESGDTFDSNWTLSNSTGKSIQRVLVDAAPGLTVFDTRALGDIFGTPGSARGRDFTVTSGGEALDIVATYRDEVALVPSPPVGDLFRHLDVAFTNAGGFADGSVLTFITDTDNIDPLSEICPEGLTKKITSGPDVDGDGDIDLIVEVGKMETTVYDFTITYSDPNGPPVLIEDTVPAEWTVTHVNGIPIVDNSSGGPLPDGDGGIFEVFKTSKGKGLSATRILWEPSSTYEVCTRLIVWIETRPRPNGKFAPTSCGALCLNDGAEAFELDSMTGEPLVDDQGNRLPPIWISDGLCVGAVSDYNDDGQIAYDGTGDEDGDGLSDGQEVFVYGTDPCNPDTDGDGVPDGTDPDPLDPTIPGF